MVKRKSIIVHFRNPKAIKDIEKITDIAYYHKKRRYAVCYVDDEQKTDMIKKISSMKLVKRVEESLFETEEYNIDFNVK